jgi:hypothetical protein
MSMGMSELRSMSSGIFLAGCRFAFLERRNLPMAFILSLQIPVSRFLFSEGPGKRSPLTSTWKEPKPALDASACSSIDIIPNIKPPHQTDQDENPQETKKSIQRCEVNKAINNPKSLLKITSLVWSVPTQTRPRNLPQLLATFQLHASSPPSTSPPRSRRTAFKMMLFAFGNLIYSTSSPLSPPQSFGMGHESLCSKHLEKDPSTLDSCKTASTLHCTDEESSLCTARKRNSNPIRRPISRAGFVSPHSLLFSPNTPTIQ